jgi:hypothetical protein
MHAGPLTVKLKHIPDRIFCDEEARGASHKLKAMLCMANVDPLAIIDASKLFSLSVDSCD